LIKTVFDEHPAVNITPYFYLVNESQESCKIGLLMTSLSKKFWGFKKPGTEVGAHFYKVLKCGFFISSFHPNWIKKNIPFDKLDENLLLKIF
jgi:hypothetical protein